MKKFAWMAAAVMSVVMLAACDDGNDGPGGGSSGTYPRRIDVEVVSYSPAPGQFVNVIPEYTSGATYATMCRRAQEALNGGSLVTLGAFGGSITLRLSEPIYNTPGYPDFQVLGNAFAGNAEPGIVSVSRDGYTWYNLAGEHYSEGSDLIVMYVRPADDATNEHYIRYRLFPGGDGEEIGEGWFARQPQYHSQPYYPQWKEPQEGGNIDGYVLEGRRLPDNATWDEARRMYVLEAYEGYADCYPNDDARSYLNIDNAVDANGDRVDLGYIKYVRVTTAVLQDNGAIGECSTEVAGIVKLHD